ncbi:MAG: hypothetical protein ACRDVP_12755 [Acidimicrobiales bacterium]
MAAFDQPPFGPDRIGPGPGFGAGIERSIYGASIGAVMLVDHRGPGTRLEGTVAHEQPSPSEGPPELSPSPSPPPFWGMQPSGAVVGGAWGAVVGGVVVGGAGGLVDEGSLDRAGPAGAALATDGGSVVGAIEVLSPEGSGAVPIEPPEGIS